MSKNTVRYGGIACLVLMVLLLAPSAMAQSSYQTAPRDVIATPEKALSLLDKIINWIYTFAIVFSIVMALYAAFVYLTSQGNPEKVTTANKTLVFVAVGVAVAILAGGVPKLIEGLIK